jgi:hypothetical protein
MSLRKNQIGYVQRGGYGAVAAARQVTLAGGGVVLVDDDGLVYLTKEFPTNPKKITHVVGVYNAKAERGQIALDIGERADQLEEIKGKA